MILVGMDFRDDSWAALLQARFLSRATGMPMEVLHVSEYGGSERWQPGPEELRALEAAGLNPEEIRIRRGVPWVELVRYAKERSARIIVAGRHGGAGFQPFSLGSTAQRLATASRNPVLLVSRASERKKGTGRRWAHEADSAPERDFETNGTPTSSEAS